MLLGVTINTQMKVSEQCGMSTSNSNQNDVIGMLRRNITSRPTAYKEHGLNRVLLK